ncbi:MAG: hypothetical protein P9L99_15085 [Candidatus Lernaella stagnicola]|nr:hypothetical protein [Candidatus Lernaella stagnicola]
MTAPTRHFVILLCALGLLWAGCGDEPSTRASFDDPKPDGVEGNITDGADDSTTRIYGLWLGAWDGDGFFFQRTPAPATLAPSMGYLDDGSLALVTVRRIKEYLRAGTEDRELLFLLRRGPSGVWRDPLILANNTWWTYAQPAILPDFAGRIHVLFSLDGAPTHLSVQDDRVDIYPMQPGPGAAKYFTMAQSPFGFIHAVFGEYDLSHQVFVGDSWLELNEFLDAAYPELAFNRQHESNARLVFLRHKGINDACTLFHFEWFYGKWQGKSVMPEIDFYPVPHISVDEQGRSHILCPSSVGLVYMVQDETEPGGWRMEIVAGGSLNLKNEHIDLAVSGDEPFIAFRDTQTAQGYMAHRTATSWEVGEVAGFEPGFIGMELAVDPAGVPHLIFAGERVMGQ